MPSLLSPRTILAGVLAAAVLVGLPQPASAGTHASFRSGCELSHSLHDDPIVFPGQPGASHLHDFFGNTTTDAFSTYESLRAGSTTCDRAADTAAYWVPALYEDGEKVDPSRFAAYYRGGNKEAGTIEAPPADLRIIADDATWACAGALPVADPTGGCPLLSDLQLRLQFPDCWDGAHTDSTDHRSHMAYSELDAGTGDNVCPDSHPVPVPELELTVTYPGVTGPWSLASGSPETSHGDFLNAWDQAALERRVDNCLNDRRLLGTGLLC